MKPLDTGDIEKEKEGGNWLHLQEVFPILDLFSLLGDRKSCLYIMLFFETAQRGTDR